MKTAQTTPRTIALLIVLMCAATLQGPVEAKTLPLVIGTQKQLFIDDRIVEKTQAISRVMNQPRKYEGGPVLKPEKAWEGNLTALTSVIYDEEERIWKMWYSARKITAERPPRPIEEYENYYRASKYKEEGNFTCYATSRDGIHWERPALGLVEFEGSKQNNIVPVARGMGWLMTMIKDAHEQDPTRRYKGVGSWILKDGMIRAGHGKRNNGVGVFFSPDGIHATPFEGNPVLHLSGDVNPTLIGWDEQMQKYIGYFRPSWDHATPNYERLSPPAGKLRVRTIAYSESEDFVRWTPMEPALIPDQKDQVDLQFYGMPAIKYEGYYLGFPWLFKTNRLTMESGFAYSHDGKNYLRLGDRGPFLPLGSNGTWDDACVYLSRPVVRADTLWFYYAGLNWAHTVVDMLAEGEKAGGAIGLATLPLDGFVSLEAGPNPGTITIRPLVFKGNRLIVNFEASLKGSAGVDDASSLRIELLDPEGNPLRGFELEQAEPIHRTGVRQLVSWKSDRSLASVAAQPVQLRFHLRNGKLYSFQFVDR